MAIGMSLMNNDLGAIYRKNEKEMIGKVAQCKHCGKKIIFRKMSFGYIFWDHENGENECSTMVAEPEEE